MSLQLSSTWPEMSGLGLTLAGMTEPDVDATDPDVAGVVAQLERLHADLNATYAMIESLRDRRAGWILAGRFQQLMTQWRGITAKLRKVVASWLRDERGLSFADMADELGVQRGTAGGMYLPKDKRRREL